MVINIKSGSKAHQIFSRLIEDKRAISQYVKEGKDLRELEQQRGIRFVNPLQL